MALFNREKKRLAEEQRRDQEILNRHYELQRVILDLYPRRDREPSAYKGVVTACGYQIDLATATGTALRRQQVMVGSTPDRLPRHIGYENLANIREKEGDYSEAIRLCRQAQSEGWAGEWDVRIGRLERKSRPASITKPQASTARPQPSRASFTLESVLALSPTEFEQICVRALTAMGYRNVVRTGGSGDLGADITAADSQGRSTIVQCKRYAPHSKIGSPVIQTFIGMLQVHHKADRGIFMTTADYSDPAKSLARDHDILLIDGDDIIKIINLVGEQTSFEAFLPTTAVNDQPGQPSASASTPPTCSRCGALCRPQAKFCPSCGTKVL